MFPSNVLYVCKLGVRLCLVANGGVRRLTYRPREDDGAEAEGTERSEMVQ